MIKKIGIYNPNLNTKGGGEKVCLALAESLAGMKNVTPVLITHEMINTKELEKYFGVSLRGVEVQILTPSINVKRIRNRLSFLPEVFKHYLENRDMYRKIKYLNLDIFMNNAYNTDLPSPAPVGIYMCMFPHKLIDITKKPKIKKLLHQAVGGLSRMSMHKGVADWLETYDVITANSEFTKHYIKKYWNRDSTVIYPICDDLRVPGVQKKKMILNVGRFFYNNGITHHKRQDFLLDEFLKMTDLHREGWELHFAGTVNHTPEDMQYAIDLLGKAEGYPVFFHFNAKFKTLKTLYSEASIYWHATGYGVDPHKNPERQEHFGISTVEAMATGAIPVVISTAGQKEVVVDGLNGYLWATSKELREKTKKAASTKTLISRNEIFFTAKRFDKINFQNSARGIIENLRPNNN